MMIILLWIGCTLCCIDYVVLIIICIDYCLYVDDQDIL